MGSHAQPAATLTQFLLRSQPSSSRGEFTLLMMAVQTAVKTIEKNIRAAGMLGLFGHPNSNTSNATGDAQTRLDVLANTAFKAYLLTSTCVAFLGSEEEESLVLVGTEQQGRYLVFFDPIDGSSNIDANLSVGSIWGIWRLPVDKNVETLEEAHAMLQHLSGNFLISAGYAMYGSATNLVLTTGNGVEGFTLDSTIGEFIHTHQRITLPLSHPVYSVNEGNSRNWEPWFQRYIHHIKHESKNMYSLRYVGSMVADIHRTLLYGGIFLYPGDRKQPDGKLRLLYEAAPVAMIIEQAGGRASAGKERVLDIAPRTPHQRVPVYMGSRHEVNFCLSFQKEEQHLLLGNL